MAVVTRERVLDVAMAIVEAEGVEGLSMRALATKLGVAVTAIYWHVGNKDELLAALVERVGTEVGGIRTTGRTPEQRVVSTARSLLRSIEAHGSLVGLAFQQGRLDIVLDPARARLGEELAAAGLRGAALADAVNAVVLVVTTFSHTEAVVQRSPAPEHEPPDTQRTFDVALRALVRGLLP
jgi:TetR/AcrR family transcriptional regulator, tetracycline repressor protein